MPVYMSASRTNNLAPQSVPFHLVPEFISKSFSKKFTTSHDTITFPSGVAATKAGPLFHT